MIHLAVHYNNLGVDILSSNQEVAKHKASINIDRDEMSGKASRKRRKYTNADNATVKRQEKYIGQNVDEALACFQKALSLIVKTTEHHHYYSSGLEYHPSDDDNFLGQENEATVKRLVGSINPCATKIDLEGDRGCSNSYIYWKAIKIGDDQKTKTKTNHNKLMNFDNIYTTGEGRHIDADGDGYSGCDFTRQRYNSRCEVDHVHEKTWQHRHSQKRSLISGGYDSLTTSIFHSMICIYNIALCYQYKGMAIKEKAKRLESAVIAASTIQNPYHSFEFGGLVASAEFFLKASVDHYTRAYELMTRFRLENSSQYMVLMASMNNLAATYQSLEETYKADICNRHLVQSLIMIICSSERDGHLGQEVLSRSNIQDETDERKDHRSGVLSRKEDRISFESFLANVTYLMLGGHETYRGQITAVAA